jgi:hypothetical protein
VRDEALTLHRCEPPSLQRSTNTLVVMAAMVVVMTMMVTMVMAVLPAIRVAGVIVGEEAEVPMMVVMAEPVMAVVTKTDGEDDTLLGCKALQPGGRRGAARGNKSECRNTGK